MTSIHSRAALPQASADENLPHLSGPAAAIRQVLAAHFLRDCPHIVEIGGHVTPVTQYLMHKPRSVLSVDPKTPPFEADMLHGFPCQVRHVQKKFQEVAFDLEPRSYGLVLLGYSLRPFGSHDALGDILFGLVDNAQTVVIEHSPNLDRASSQIPGLLGRPSMTILCSFALDLDDHAIARSPYRRRQFYVLHPAG